MLIEATSSRCLPPPTLLGAMLAAMLCAIPAHADESPWSAPSGTAVRLLAGGSDGARLRGGVEIRLSPGWKTYWRYPGDSGVPPRFNWSGSENLAGVEVLWPAPMRFSEGDGAFSIGYKRDVVLPLRITPTDPARPVTLRLDLEYAVCEKICQPAHADVTLSLPPGGSALLPAPLATAERAVPVPAGLGAPGATGITAAALEQRDGVTTLRIEAKVQNPAGADLFVEGPNEDWALPLPKRQAAEPGKAVFLMPVEGMPKGADIDTATLRFTLTDGDDAVEVDAGASRR
ncbi:MAG TPA: protein-disulfide reductase DsbD domain-containing protein [Xanthobacteraceae bacterium]|nr:protein-disulfide reductase DsbD domain-containing protein [Xanthobacteraceae bacterium]